MTNTAGLHPSRDEMLESAGMRKPGSMSTWFRKRLIVRFLTTLFSFERPRSVMTRLFQSVEHGSARTLKSA